MKELMYFFAFFFCLISNHIISGQTYGLDQCTYYANNTVYCPQMGDGSVSGGWVADDDGNYVECAKNPKACREILEEADHAEKSPEGDPGSGNGGDEPTTPAPADPEDEEEEESRMSQGTKQALHKSKIQFQRLRNKKKGLYIRKKGQFIHLQNWQAHHNKIMASLGKRR